MAFRTKLDFSDNRQVIQQPHSLTVLSGGTSFGVPFESLPSGIDISTSAQTNSYAGVGSTFSGNASTSVYTWGYPEMALGFSTLSAITASNSGITQSTSAYTPSDYITVDGNIIPTAFSGVSFDVTPVSVYSLGGGNYSGTVVTTNLVYFSANTLGFTGRTIWVDVSGITRTNNLIITNNPSIGSVFVCTTSEGQGAWMPFSAGTSGLWIVGSGANSVMMNNGTNSADGDFSHAEGQNTQAIGENSHAEGFETIASGDTSHAQGYQSIAGGMYSHAEGYGSKSIGSYSHVEGVGSVASGDTSHAEGQGCIASGEGSHAEGYSTKSIGNFSHAEGYSTQAIGENSHAEGRQTSSIGENSHAEGYFSLASGDTSHAEGNYTQAIGINSHAEGSSTSAFGISSHAEGEQNSTGGDWAHVGGYQSQANGMYSFVHGYQSRATGIGTIVLGNQITGTTNNRTYIESLNIKTLSVFADNTAAASLPTGTVYRTSTGQLMIKY